MPAPQVFALAADFLKASAGTAPVLTASFQAAGELFAEAWQSNAVATSGERGAHYPATITSEIKPGLGGVHVETGPDSARKGGAAGRGYEFGSMNQPPHLDGLRALPAAEAGVTITADKALWALFP